MADKWQPEEIMVRQTIPVNLVLVGDMWNATTQNKIKEKLQSSYKPIIFSELSRAGIQYDYQYNFVSVNDKVSKDFFDFMKSQARDIKPFFGGKEFIYPWGIAVWIRNSHPEWVNKNFERYEIDYKLIDAQKVEDYLNDNIISKDPNLSKANAANLIFIADDMSKINFLHNFELKRVDAATKRSHQAIGLMGYGGRYNFYFFDLYAVPWHSYQGFPNFYDPKMQNYATDFIDIKTDEKRAKLISDYVNNATSLLITPTYIYPPTYKSNYVLDLVIVSASRTGSGTVSTSLEHFINQEKLKSQFESLIPYSQWQIKLSMANFDSRDIPNKLKEIVQDTKRIKDRVNPDYTYEVLDTKKLVDQVTEWATTRTSTDIKDYREIQKSSWTIPVVIVVGNRDKPIYLYEGDSILLGIAPGHPDDPSQPCCVLGVTYDNAVWDDNVGLTDLVLHETGHVLSFMHPFYGFSGDDEPFVNQYFNWYGSVMAYNSPPNSCGLWYSVYVKTSCGIADTFYTKFEKDNFARGVTLFLMKTTKSNVYRTMINLESVNKDPNNPPDDVTHALSSIESKLRKAETSLAKNELLGNDGSIQSAFSAATESEEIAKKYGVIYSSSIKPLEPNLHIPDWIKSTAKWWSVNNITDSNFVNSIQYLIKERIIVIPNLAKSGQATEQSVPSWIKNNAGWWADGKISDQDFVKGIQYLVEKGIIKI
ncbi:MAG: hypothetical protein HY295_06085 [Thaumarchaeota archaeon]|nr:hypothetical protein [Nitrososphaerota archaeon]